MSGGLMNQVARVWLLALTILRMRLVSTIKKAVEK
jgi:hypothetical protein